MTEHTTCGRIRPNDGRLRAACVRPLDHDAAHANARGETWAEPKQRGPYVGPRGESTREEGPVPSWTDDELQRAEEHVRELLQRELEHAHHLATVPTHGQPAGRTQGYYAARAYLLACHLFPLRIVQGLPTEGDLELDPHAIIALPNEPTVVRASHYCPRCGTTGLDAPEEHAEVCALLMGDRAAKNRD